MRIEDVKVGDVVIPRQFQGKYLLPGGRHIRWTESEMRQFVGAKATVLRVDADTSVSIKLADSRSYWWPVEHCDLARTSPLALPSEARTASKPDQSNATQLLHHLHGSEISDLRRSLDNAVKEAEAAERALTAVRSEAATEAKVFRSQIAALEKQVADLKSERDRVGKTSQSGTRFAQLELD